MGHLQHADKVRLQNALPFGWIEFREGAIGPEIPCIVDENVVERWRPNTPAYPKQPQTNFFARFIFVSPTSTRTGPFSKCGNWSESRLPRLPIQWTRQASSRRPTPPNVRNRTSEETLPRKDILSEFGITDWADLRVQVIEKHGSVPMVDVHGPGDPVKTLTPKQAEELSALLRDAGEEALGQEIAAAAASPQKANWSRTS
jgi:hypothetical protein